MLIHEQIKLSLDLSNKTYVLKNLYSKINQESLTSYVNFSDKNLRQKPPTQKLQTNNKCLSCTKICVAPVYQIFN